MSRQGLEGYRNMSNGSNPSLASSGPSANPQSRPPPNSSSPSPANRAERFEDEKRRIIESCFSKQDPNGQLAESYITHIRIQEDSQYPSSPPPPDSSPDNKKPRLIIIAVRSTGRVRMHKARENSNGSFSIGKTWNMEELSAIETYAASSPPQSDREAQQRAWAGPTGFTVTVTKPYYWQAGTPKEKEFFIASAVKIYRKYTKGQVPELRGFDEHQKNAILGLPSAQPGPPPRPMLNGSRAPSAAPSANEAPAPPQPPFASRPQSRENSRYRESPGPPPSLSDRDHRAPSTNGSRAPSEGHSPARFNEPSMPRPRPFASQEQLRTQRSRDAIRPDSRPGTSSGAAGGVRSPPPLNHMPPSPGPNSGPYSPVRVQTPVNGSMPPGRDRPQSPLRNQSGQEEQVYASMNGSAGAEALAASRQRFGEKSSNSSPSSISRVARAEDPHTKFNAQGYPRHGSDESKPQRQDKEAAPTNEASTLSMLTGEPVPRGPPAVAAASVPDPGSPPTPERSRRRPPLVSNTSASSQDLRPAPLNSRGRPSDAAATPAESGESTRGSEDLPRVLPLSPARNRVDTPPPAEVLPVPKPSVAEELSKPEQPEQPQEAAVEPEAEEEQYRPGLGPMIKKRGVADRFKRAATAANAFKPRPGGAAEKILKAKAEREASGAPAEPDGITGVVPRPALKQETASQEDFTLERKGTDVSVKEPVPVPKEPVQQAPPVVEIFYSTPIEETKDSIAFNGMDGTSQGVELHDDAPQTPIQQQNNLGIGELDNNDLLSIRQQPAKVKRREPQQLRYLEELGIDSSLLSDKGIGFETMLYDFGWADSNLSPKALHNMEADLRREQARLEAGAWLSTPAQESVSAKDDKEKQVLSLLDKAIQECDEMDGLLTIYHVELSSLDEDIAFIEAQSQGLQVQSANQQLLYTELSSLLETMSLDKRTMDPLRRADLSQARGLQDVEHALIKLYQAMITIDPSIRAANVTRRKSRNVISESNELASMSALRQKREVYERESSAFCQRVLQFLDQLFSQSFSDAKQRALEPASSGAMKLRKESWSEARRPMWMYSPLVLFAKELNPLAWQSMLKQYQIRVKPLYVDAFGKNVASWKRTAKKSTGEEADILFTAQEKEETTTTGGALSSARKMTVKRSHTLARTLRNAGGSEKSSPAETRYSGSLMSSEVFAGSVDEMAVLVSQEQNFIVDFFHATSLENADFIDVVMAYRPDDRLGTNLQSPKPTEPNRDVARQVTVAMEEVFGFFSSELSSLLEWAVKADSIQGVGIMACLNRHSFFLQESSQDFLIQLIEQLRVRLQSLFNKFVQDQVRAIEETKVKIKKRKGVIAFMKIFPHFSAAVENIFSAVAGADYDNQAACMLETRKTVDEAYGKINRAMFDSLKVIAKESPTAVPQAAVATAAKATTDDPEDKEMLNYHILLIENMNHYIEEVDDGGKEGVLAEWKGKALMERAEALDGYVGRVMRRPLGKLLDYLDSIDSVKESHPHNPSAITSRPTYARKAARNVLGQYDSKEVRRGIEVLRKRIEKHFGDADDEAISRALVTSVCKECERAYERTIIRCEEMITELYPPTEGEKPVELDFSNADVQAGFRR